MTNLVCISTEEDGKTQRNPTEISQLQKIPVCSGYVKTLPGLLSLSVCSLIFISACSDSNPADPINGVSDVVATEGVSTQTVDQVGVDGVSDDVAEGVAAEELTATENLMVVESPDLESETNEDEVVADTMPAPDTSTSVDTIVGAMPVDTDTPTEAAPEFEARYTLTFEALWSVDTHPTNFPDDPHFSGLVGAVHNEQVVLWEPGQIASGGVEVVAESGAKTSFLDEINAVINDGRALSAIDGAGVATSPGEQSVDFLVNRDYPLVTVLTMLAPSPDWMLGVHGLNMLDGNSFVDSMTVELALYDAGTDSGLTYTSADEDTQPRGTIQFVTSDAADSDFIDGLPLAGRFRIVRQ